MPLNASGKIPPRIIAHRISPPLGGDASISLGDLTTNSVAHLIAIGDNASRKQIDSCYVLSNSQKERANGLGFVPERIKTLERVMTLCISTLKKISGKEGCFPESERYLESITYAYGSRGVLYTQEEDIPKAELESLIEYVFSEENKQYGVPYIMAYFAGFIDPMLEERILNIRVLTGLLDFWRKIGPEHDSFGRVPMDLIPAADIFKFYTTFFDGEWRYEVPSIDKKGQLKPRDCKVTHMEDVPDTFARIGMHNGTREDIELDIAHYEVLYVLRCKTYRHLRPSAKGLRGFIKKHSVFLSKSGHAPWESLRPGEEGVWQGAKKILQQIIEEQDQENARIAKTSKNKKIKPSPQKPPSSVYQPIAPKALQPPPQSPPQSNRVPNIVGGPYSAPIIRESTMIERLCMEEQCVGNTVKLSASSFCTNLPEGAALAIWDYGRTRRGAHPRIYSRDDEIELDALGPGESWKFKFRFVPIDTPVKDISGPWLTEVSIVNPHRIRISPETPAGNTGSKNPDTLVTRVSRDAVMTLEHTATPIETPTETLALEILGGIEKIEIVRESPKALRITLPGREDLRLIYNIEDQTFSQGILPEDVDLTELLPCISKELEAILNKYTAKEAIEEAVKEKEFILSSFSFVEAFLHEKFTEVGGNKIPDITIPDSFLLTRTHDRSGLDYLISEYRYVQVFRAFKERCLAENGIYLDISRTDPIGEAALTLSLKGKAGISATITSIAESPYYILSDMSGFEAQISTAMQSVLKRIFLFLSGAGRTLAKINYIPPSKAPYTMSRDGIVSLFGRQFRHSMDSKHTERTELERIVAIQKRITNGDIKICTGIQMQPIVLPDGIKREQVPLYTISTIRNGAIAEMLRRAPDTVKVLYRDECLAFMRNGSGHTNIYSRIRANDRLKKYLAIRMIHAINPELLRDDIPDPIPPEAKEHMMGAWDKITPEIQQEFLSCFSQQHDGSITRALDVIDDGISVFDALLDSFETNKVKIIYHSPGWVTLGKIRENTVDTRN